MSWFVLDYRITTFGVGCWDDISSLYYCFWSMVACYFSCYLDSICFIICFISVISFILSILALFFMPLFCLSLGLSWDLHRRLLSGFFTRTSFLIVFFLWFFMEISQVLRFEDLYVIFSLKMCLFIHLLLINLAYAAISSSLTLLLVWVLSLQYDEDSISICYLCVLLLLYLWHLPMILWNHFSFGFFEGVVTNFAHRL